MKKFAVSREPDDKSGVLRASVGGNKVIGYYLVFRGHPRDVIDMLEDIAVEARRALEAGDYQDLRGRPQG